MASISYWFLSPSVILALIGKLKGPDRTRPTPAFDWRKATIDVVIPARNEESRIALCLASLFEQNFPLRKITVVDDGSSDRTPLVVRRFQELSGRNIELVMRLESNGKTPSVREQCQSSDADALLVLDADTVLVDRSYVSRCVEKLFKNAGVASACGEVGPLTRHRRRTMTRSNPLLQRVQFEFGHAVGGPRTHLNDLLEYITVIYREGFYVFLQRLVYDGHMKVFGSRLNPIGCAVVYHTRRLRECFRYFQPKIGDNLSTSEDIFIGHFFAWKGWRNVQIMGVRCASSEPTIFRLPGQLYLWSSSFLQSLYYFRDLPLSPFKQITNALLRPFSRRDSKIHNRRRIQEQYRAPWGEEFTRRFGRRIGLADLTAFIEKISYPVLLIYLAAFNREALLITIGLETALATIAALAVADRGARLKSAGMLLATTPIRLLSLGVDLVAAVHYFVDLTTGNRNWRK